MRRRTQPRLLPFLPLGGLGLADLGLGLLQFDIALGSEPRWCAVAWHFFTLPYFRCEIIAPSTQGAGTVCRVFPESRWSGAMSTAIWRSPPLGVVLRRPSTVVAR